MTNSPILSVSDLTVSFGDADVLSHVDFSLDSGEYVGLIGPNGAGKTTLLKAIIGMIQPNSGKISAPARNKIGYVPQQFLLKTAVPISVKEVLRMGFANLSFWHARQEKTVMEKVLHFVGFESDILAKNYQSLSGGQKQRIVIARSLIGDPQLLLFDEPLSGVDYATKLRIYDLLAKLNREHGITILFVSHEVDTVVSKCQRILCLDKTLHHGCHPVHFAKGEPDSCLLPNSDERITHIHHHSHPSV